MLIGNRSNFLLQQTRAKAKMYEYSIPAERHIYLDPRTDDLILVTMGVLVEITSYILGDHGPYTTVPENLKKELEFTAKFYDAFHDAKLLPAYSSYYLLLGASAYYFADFLGSSKVMASMIRADKLDLGCGGMEKALVYLLSNDVDAMQSVQLDDNRIYCDELIKLINYYYKWEKEYSQFNYEFIAEYRSKVHNYASSREILLCDIFSSIMLLKVTKSARTLLAQYSGLPEDVWKPYLNSNITMQELWPAQIRLGQDGILHGKSAVIQMPTSSGKTTSMSLTIRAAFLSQRTSLAIVVAPFRALCREISDDLKNEFVSDQSVSINEFSDIPDSKDIDTLFEFLESDNQSILIFTPEKLLYVLRQNQELLGELGLIIFDEAHLFDDPSRGARFELLISSIFRYIKNDVQKILISAVVPNASQINNWFTSGPGKVIEDNSIKATEKAIAIVDWEWSQKERYGYLYFLSNDDYETTEFYVPRLIKVREIAKLGRERKTRIYPDVDFKTEKVKNNDLAIEISRQVISNGSVAIYCGRKDSVDLILRRINDLKARGVDVSAYARNIACDEDFKIAHLIKANYGCESIYYTSALNGVFPHHRGIANGIKIAIEYAMRNNLIQFVVCTSTLAQGVNLPIRYLIVSSIYQANERIKVRDFHNLIGRAGRAGRYTEGTIILSEPFVYSNRNTSKKNWKWHEYKQIINPENSESCLSQLLYLVQGTRLEFAWNEVVRLNTYKFSLLKYSDIHRYQSEIERIIHSTQDNYPDKINMVKSAISQMETCLESIESYLLPLVDNDNGIEISDLLIPTFGYALATEDEKKKLTEIFTAISNYLINGTPDKEQRVMYSRTLLGVTEIKNLETYIETNYAQLVECVTKRDLIDFIIPLIADQKDNGAILKLVSVSDLALIAKEWILGLSYEEIYNHAKAHKIKKYRGVEEIDIELSDIISICDEGLGYAATLITNAIYEICKKHYGNKTLCTKIMELNRSLRYGLPTLRMIGIYEFGFADRYIAQLIDPLLGNQIIRSKYMLELALKSKQEHILEILKDYPSLYQEIARNL